MTKVIGFEIVHKIPENKWITVRTTPQAMFDLISQYNRGKFGWSQVRVKIKEHKDGCSVKRSKRGEKHGIVG